MKKKVQKKSPKISAPKQELINLKFSQNGTVKDIQTDNILTALRDFPLEPKLLKTPLRIEASYLNKTFGVVLSIPKVRILAVNLTTRGLLARQLGIGVGANYQ